MEISEAGSRKQQTLIDTYHTFTGTQDLLSLSLCCVSLKGLKVNYFLEVNSWSDDKKVDSF